MTFLTVMLAATIYSSRLSVIVLTVIQLTVIQLTVIQLTVIQLTVIQLTVMAPILQLLLMVEIESKKTGYS